MKFKFPKKLPKAWLEAIERNGECCLAMKMPFMLKSKSSTRERRL